MGYRAKSISHGSLCHLGMSLHCGWRRWPPDVEIVCKYIRYGVVDNRQGTVLYLRLSVGLTTPHHKEIMLRNVNAGPWTWMDSLEKLPKLRNWIDCSPDIIMVKSRRGYKAGHVARMETKRKEYRISVRKSEGKRPLGSNRL
jgi:hypothetical protein